MYILLLFAGLIEVSFVYTALDVVEGESELEVCVELFLPEGNDLGFDVSVFFNSTDGIRASMFEIGSVIKPFNMYVYSVATGNDYILPDPATVTFLASDVLSSQCINVTIVDDMDYEGNQSFSIGIDSVTFPAIAVGDEVFVTILDNHGESDRFSLIII